MFPTPLWLKIIATTSNSLSQQLVFTDNQKYFHRCQAQASVNLHLAMDEIVLLRLYEILCKTRKRRDLIDVTMSKPAQLVRPRRLI